jgi:hypothetical protein
MQQIRLALAFAIALVGAAAMAEAAGKPPSVPVGPPSTPVEKPTTPPENPPDDLIDFVCSILAVPHLCDE